MSELTHVEMQKFRKSMNEMKRESKIEECFHPTKAECILPIKQAHSLQRNGRLSLIEEEINGQNSLYTVTSFKPGRTRMIEDFVPVGKKIASTFNGFCSKHDTDVFSPIENFPFDGSDKHMFLHSYRSFAHSYHSKLQEVQLYKSDWEVMKLMPKENKDATISAAELGLNDMKPEKEYLDNLLVEEKYDELIYSLMETNDFFPFGCSSLVGPHYTVNNEPIDDWFDETKPWVTLMLTVIPDKKNSISIVAANPNIPSAAKFIDHLDELNDESYELAISTLMMKMAENTFWSPKLWDSLSEGTKTVIKNDVNFIQGRDIWYNFPWSSLNLYKNNFTAFKLGIIK